MHKAFLTRQGILFSVWLLTTNYSGHAQVVNFEWSVPALNQPCGGEKSAVKLIQREFVYPDSAFRKELDGLVVISFGIDKQGHVIHQNIDSATTGEMGREALRMFQLLRWPADNRRIIMDRGNDKFYLTFRRKDWVSVYRKRKYMQPEYPYSPIDSTYTLYLPQHTEKPPLPVYKKKSYDSYLHYFAERLVYPENARKLGLTGEVIVEWVVESSGRISNLYIRQGLQGGCNEEALRLVKSLEWMPGQKNGKYVRTLMAAAIGFGVPSRGDHEIIGTGTPTGGN
ncbi:MAG: energy transducer TonB [Flavobacteriales bacterium]|nr:energy transducer TonB [Flavobacteriales bacterium]